jgi:hypothetical protein
MKADKEVRIVSLYLHIFRSRLFWKNRIGIRPPFRKGALEVSPNERDIRVSVPLPLPGAHGRIHF